MRFGGDERLFAGAVPPWPESRVGRELGEQLARHYAVPFWFPSPDEPDADCPNWWERDRAVPCRECEKPILRRAGGHLPAEYCYHCHLRREARERVQRDEPSSPNGVTILLGDGVTDRQIMYSFRHGMTARTDFVLRALQAAGGDVTTPELVAACARDVDAAAVEQALAQLVALGHATDDGGRVRLTRSGQHLR